MEKEAARRRFAGLSGEVRARLRTPSPSHSEGADCTKETSGVASADWPVTVFGVNVMALFRKMAPLFSIPSTSTVPLLVLFLTVGSSDTRG